MLFRSAVASAWPTYENRKAPPGLQWVFRESCAYRDTMIARAAAALGVPVILADATGPGLRGECGLWDGRGRRIARGAMVSGEAASSEGGGRLFHTGSWRWFAPLYGACRQPSWGAPPEPPVS